VPTVASVSPSSGQKFIYRNQPAIVHLTRTDSTDYQKIETSQADFAAGTLSNVQANADGSLSLSLTNDVCLSFDGTTNAYVSFASNPLNGVTNNMTVEGVAQLTSGVSGILVIVGDGSSNGFAVYVDALGKLDVYCYTQPTQAVSDFVVTAGQPFRFKACRDSGTWKIWVNGTARTVTGNPTPVAPSNALMFGSNGASNRLTGKLDEVRLWSINSPSNDVTVKVAGTETGLVGAWHCDENTGSSIADCTSGGRTGTLHSGNGWSTITAPYGTTPATSGNRVSPAYALSTVAVVGGTWISWTADVPSGCTLTVEASVNGTTWYACTNGAPIPTILTEGTNVSAVSLYLRESMTGPGTATPTLYDVTVTFRPVEVRSVEIVVNGVSCTVANGLLDYWNTAIESGSAIVDCYKDVYLATLALWWDYGAEEVTLVVKYKSSAISTTTFTTAGVEPLGKGESWWFARAVGGIFDGPMSAFCHYFVTTIEPWLLRGEFYYLVEPMPRGAMDCYYWIAHMAWWDGPGAAVVGEPALSDGPGAAIVQAFARGDGPGAVIVQGYVRGDGPGAAIVGLPMLGDGPGAAAVGVPMVEDGPGAVVIYEVNRRNVIEVKSVSAATKSVMDELGIEAADE
jgi:Concanavalin A-like lectin/glucanases superfamily